MAATVYATTPARSNARTTDRGAASSPDTPGDHDSARVAEDYARILQEDAFPADEGYTLDPEGGAKRASKTCRRLKSMVLKGDWGEVPLTPQNALHVLSDVYLVKLETHGWKQGYSDNHQAHAGYMLALRLDNKDLCDYLWVMDRDSGKYTKLTEEEKRQRRVDFYRGVLFRFEKWFFSKAPRNVKEKQKRQSLNQFRLDRWKYVVHRCGFLKTDVEEPEVIVIDEE